MASKIATRDVASQLEPEYSFALDWEENFDFQASVDSFKRNWHLPFIISIAIYLPVLYVGQIIMRNRSPLNIKKMMIVWNSGLAIFSIIGFTRVFPEMLHSLNKFGYQHSICNNSYIHVKQCRFWIYLFVLSKIPELGDTLFLVMRKQRLIFLHVYHHASVLVFSWFAYAYSMASSRWFCTMNFGVHSIMYTYYVLKAFPNIIKVPKWISMLITALQTIQMMIGAYLVINSYHVKLSGQKCNTDTPMTLFGLIIYTSYLFLFSQFFLRAYCAPSPPRDDKNAEVSKKHA